jgi:hypothetical protein
MTSKFGPNIGFQPIFWRTWVNKEKIKELQDRRKNGELIKDLMADYGLSKTSVYRYLREN